MDKLIIGALGVAFVVLKLTHVITWSWLWVTAPFWGGFALAGVLVIILLIVGGVAAALDAKSPNDVTKLAAVR